MQIIRNRTIVDDDYVHVADESEPPQSGKIIVSLSRWKENGPRLLEGFQAIGVRLPSDKLPADVPHLDRLSLIAIEFPRFTDGRGYSVARMLRQREGFQGELRAVGWVLRDNLLYMERCGFNSFELAPGKSIEIALGAFDELEVVYQATAVDPRPLYRRR